MVSIMISIGMRGIGVPCGRKWAKEDLGLYRKPKITAPAHRGTAMPKFIDSWVVGVNECGSSPNRLVDPMKIISDVSIRAHVRPLVLCIAIICFMISLTTHCWIATKRLLTSRDVVGNRMLGKAMIRTTIGRPINVGVMKEANRFSFIFGFKVCLVFLSLWFWFVVNCSNSSWIILVEIE